MNLGKVVLLVLASVVVMLIFPVCGEIQRTDQVESAGKAALGTEAHAGTIAPCTLISKAQVAEIFGEPFQDGENKSQEINPLGQRICFWNTAASRSFRFLQVSIIKTSDMPASTVPEAETVFRQTKEKINPIQTVTNVGDDAFWSMLGLHLLQGDVYIHIAVGNSNRPGNLEIAKKVAAIVLGNLKN